MALSKLRMNMPVMQEVEITTADSLSHEFECLSVTAFKDHQNTNSYAKHKALGKFYENVSEFKDRLNEYMIGMGYMSKVSSEPVDADEDTVEEAMEVLRMIKEFAMMQNDEAIKNMTGEFMEMIGSLKYFLRFP
jgi:hypothetical protein